jgi:hypothetical protein
MTFSMIVILYVALVGLGIFRARQRGTKIFYLVAFAVNAAATCWLLFLFKFFSSTQYLIRGLQGPSALWISWVCLLLSVLLIPVTIIGLVRGEGSQHHDVISDERMSLLRAAKRQDPAATVTLTIVVFWMVFIGDGTFGYFRSHFWLLILSVGVSAGLGWIVVILVHRWQRRDGDKHYIGNLQ